MKITSDIYTPCGNLLNRRWWRKVPSTDNPITHLQKGWWEIPKESLRREQKWRLRAVCPASPPSQTQQVIGGPSQGPGLAAGPDLLPQLEANGAAETLAPSWQPLSRAQAFSEIPDVSPTAWEHSWTERLVPRKVQNLAGAVLEAVIGGRGGTEQAFGPP